MLSAISGATKSIYLEMYAFQNDTKGFDFLSILSEKSRAGLHVVLILDSFGSYGLSSEVVQTLRRAGVEVLFFSYWFRRLHRKMLIIDENIVFLGGVNISGIHAPWNDLQVRMTGRRLLFSSLRSFSRVYKECNGKNAELLALIGKKPLLKKARAWFIEHGIGGRWLEIREQYEENIRKAQHSIILVTPYFFPRRWLLACLHEAVLRGVLIEIIIPQHTDKGRIVDRINYFQLCFFSNLGVLGFLSPEMNHSKVLLIDNKIGMVGSANLDPLSFGWNAEAGVFFDHPDMTRDLGKILEAWKLDTVIFTPEMFLPRWYDVFFTIIRRIV